MIRLRFPTVIHTSNSSRNTINIRLLVLFNFALNKPWISNKRTVIFVVVYGQAVIKLSHFFMFAKFGGFFY